MSRRLAPLLAAVAGLSLLLLALGGCPLWPAPTGGGQSGEAKLVPFDSSKDLLSYFKQQANVRFRPRSGSGFFGFLGGGDLAPTAAGGAEQGGAANDATSDDGAYTTTNIQEVGVDESDVFKSDGTYFYMAKRKSLRVVRAVPAAEMSEVGRLDLDARVDALYLLDSTIIALGTQYESYGDGEPEILMWPPYYRGSTVVVWQIDASDPTAPALVKRVELDGTAASSRVVNGRLIIVLTVVPELPASPTPTSIDVMTLEDVMPKMRRGADATDAVPWERWLRPASPDGYNMTMVMTLDASDIETVVESVAVLADAGTIYASVDALYLTDAEYDPEDNFRERTAIHKLAFDEDGAARYTASGAVPGRLLNQFSLDEREGYLRVATHVRNFGRFPIGMDIATASVGDAPADDRAQRLVPPQPYNAVYVLGESGEQLAVTGFVDGLAPGEQIHSARFMDEHGFLVTFRQIDPLFVLDLRDPENPQVVGELKVPGFSDYLHPVGDDHLIGVGKYTSPTDQGFDWFQGVQISLFDVSDWSNPTAVQQITLGGRGSFAETDRTHKAFTYLPDANLLALPMKLYTIVGEPPWQYGELTFDGVVVFRVDPATGFTELGRIENVTPVGQGYYRSPWRRAAIIDETVHALTTVGVRAAAITDFATTHTVTLAE